MGAGRIVNVPGGKKERPKAKPSSDADDVQVSDDGLSRRIPVEEHSTAPSATVRFGEEDPDRIKAPLGSGERRGLSLVPERGDRSSYTFRANEADSVDDLAEKPRAAKPERRAPAAVPAAPAPAASTAGSPPTGLVVPIDANDGPENGDEWLGSHGTDNFRPTPVKGIPSRGSAESRLLVDEAPAPVSSAPRRSLGSRNSPVEEVQVQYDRDTFIRADKKGVLETPKRTAPRAKSPGTSSYPPAEYPPAEYPPPEYPPPEPPARRAPERVAEPPSRRAPAYAPPEEPAAPAPREPDWLPPPTPRLLTPASAPASSEKPLWRAPEPAPEPPRRDPVREPPPAPEPEPAPAPEPVPAAPARTPVAATPEAVGETPPPAAPAATENTLAPIERMERELRELEGTPEPPKSAEGPGGYPAPEVAPPTPIEAPTRVVEPIGLQRDPSILGLSIGAGAGVVLAQDPKTGRRPDFAFGGHLTWNPAAFGRLAVDASAWRASHSGGTSTMTVDSSWLHIALRILWVRETGPMILGFGAGGILTMDGVSYLLKDGVDTRADASTMRPGGDLTMFGGVRLRPLEVRLEARALLRGGMRLDFLPALTVGLAL